VQCEIRKINITNSLNGQPFQTKGFFEPLSQFNGCDHRKIANMRDVICIAAFRGLHHFFLATMIFPLRDVNIWSYLVILFEPKKTKWFKLV
jgi:hypothetical protein